MRILSKVLNIIGVTALIVVGTDRAIQKDYIFVGVAIWLIYDEFILYLLEKLVDEYRVCIRVLAEKATNLPKEVRDLIDGI